MAFKWAAQAPLGCSNGLLTRHLSFQERSKTRKNTCFLSFGAHVCVQGFWVAHMSCLGAVSVHSAVRTERAVQCAQVLLSAHSAVQCAQVLLSAHFALKCCAVQCAPVLQCAQMLFSAHIVLDRCCTVRTVCSVRTGGAQRAQAHSV